jgi:hypothetical protein
MVEHTIDSATATSCTARDAAAERMRRCRARRRAGYRCFTVELHNSEIDAFVSAGLLRAGERDDPDAVATALYSHLERTLSRSP